MHKLLRPSLLALFAASAYGQTAITTGEATVVEGLFRQTENNNALNCSAHVVHPFLDFAFRFESGYTLRCPLRQFSGEANKLYTFLRITPDGHQATVLGDAYTIPALPKELQGRIDFKHFQLEAELSGVFATGEGTYNVDLLVLDGHLNAFHKSWKSDAIAHRQERNAPITMQPNTAGSAMIGGASGREQTAATPAGPRVTVLLHVAPVIPGAIKLRAWDRAFLLGSLWSLLSDASFSSVRLVAFNLDQQQEIFRQDNFRRSDFDRLSAALRKLELGTISYNKLQNQGGWSALLANLVNGESTADDPSDAVIFLGPHSRIDEKVPPEMLKAAGAAPHLFYFEYYPRYGADFPDTLQFLTSTLKGTVLKLHTPAELAEGIRKMQHVLKNPGQ